MRSANMGRIPVSSSVPKEVIYTRDESTMTRPTMVEDCFINGRYYVIDACDVFNTGLGSYETVVVLDLIQLAGREVTLSQFNRIFGLDWEDPQGQMTKKALQNLSQLGFKCENVKGWN